MVEGDQGKAKLPKTSGSSPSVAQPQRRGLLCEPTSLLGGKAEAFSDTLAGWKNELTLRWSAPVRSEANSRVPGRYSLIDSRKPQWGIEPCIPDRLGNATQSSFPNPFSLLGGAGGVSAERLAAENRQRGLLASGLVGIPPSGATITTKWFGRSFEATFRSSAQFDWLLKWCQHRADRNIPTSNPAERDDYPHQAVTPFDLFPSGLSARRTQSRRRTPETRPRHPGLFR